MQPPRAQVLNRFGVMTEGWWRFFSRLTNTTNDLDDRVSAIEASNPGDPGAGVPGGSDVDARIADIVEATRQLDSLATRSMSLEDRLAALEAELHAATSIFEDHIEQAAMSAKDFDFEVARGALYGLSSVNKFGRSTNVDSGVDTDIWDRANSGDDQDTWTAPTTARTHDIASTSANDDGNPAGTGARTLQVYGLASWDTDEVSEVITMNGTTPVTTANAYVIIHRMRVLTKGAAGPNVGVITATAQTDATVTAQINASDGQTQMAIYGVPSTKTAYMSQYYCSAIKAAASLSVEAVLLVNPEPDAELSTFLVKHTTGATTEGSNYYAHLFKPHMKISGPAIIKIQGNSSSNDTDVSAGFDLILRDN